MRKTTLFGRAIAINLALAPITVQGMPSGLISHISVGLKQCRQIDDSNAGAWNAGEVCPELNPVTFGSCDTSGGGNPPGQGTPSIDGIECKSAGGSSTTGVGGFCLGSDIGTSLAGLAKFATTDALPAKGLQYLQVTFRNGATLSGSRLSSANGNTPLVAECSSASGSNAVTQGGFCLSSDLTELATNVAKFSIANGLPAASLQFVQVTFGDRELLGGADETSNSATPKDTACVLMNGSSAVAGNPGGFCMASDLSSSTADLFANFAVANDLPVVGLQFMQIVFGQASSQYFKRSDWPAGEECESVDGSTAGIGDAGGSCMVSDLRTPSTDYFANFSIGNSLAIAGMQYLQATFGENQLPAGSAPDATSAPTDGECLSVQGSTAISGNVGGFCLVADRGRSSLGFANFAIANDLPAASLRFLQVPFGDSNAANKLGAGSEGDPIGVVVTDSLAFNRSVVPPSLVVITGNLPFDFPVFDPTFAFEPYENPDRNGDSFLSLWLGCEAADMLANQTSLGSLSNPYPAQCVRDRTLWGKLLLY